jgi:inner membrane transporter RhtA
LIIVTALNPFKSHPTVWSLSLLAIAMVSVQVGAALVKGLFPAVGVAGATTLRLTLASLMLVVVWRPWRPGSRPRQLHTILIYGASMGLMNLLFYSALERIPLGIAVAVEFAGPLGVALAASRRAVDFAWIVLAAAGIVALLPFGIEPPGIGARALSATGIAFALGSGACWAVYIVCGKRAGAAHGGAATTALGTLVGAVLVAPIGVAQAGSALLAPAILPAACAVALLSSALPYSLEMYALTRLPTRTFGVLMSAEPALGALSGLCFLGERLTVLQWAAIASIMIASGGSTATSATAVPLPRESAD